MSKSEARRIGLIGITALVGTLPLMIHGTSCGHDFVFHIQSWLRAAADWRLGLFYPHWVAAANYGAGEPRLVFYPPASWMLGALLGMVLPWGAVSVAFVLVALSGAGFALYALAREWVDRDAAAMAACLYIANPYEMFVAYERTAYGELLGAVWLPLILLYALRRPRKTVNGFLRAPEGRSIWNCSLVPLALCVGAVWLTNAPAAVIACYMLAAVAAVAAVSERQWWPLLRAASATSLGIALAAFYVLPAAFERRWVDIGRAIGPGMRIEDSFLFGHTGEWFHDQVLRTASWITVAMIFSVAGAGFAAWRGGAFASTGAVEEAVSAPRVPQRVWIPMVALPVLIFFSMFPLSDFVWIHAPELRFLQFPWRWLMVIGVCFAMLAGMAGPPWLLRFGSAAADLKGHSEAHWRGRRFLVASLFVLAICTASIGSLQRIYWQPCDEEDSVSGQISVFRGVGFEGTDEYTTPNTDNGAVPKGIPRVRLLADAHDDEADSSLEESPTWTPTYEVDDSEGQGDSKGANGEVDAAGPKKEQSSDDGDERPKPYLLQASIKVRSWEVESKEFTIETARRGFAVLQLMDYPAWEVKVNGVAQLDRPHRSDGLITVPVGAGVSTIAVRYMVTPDVKWGRAISTAALVVLLLLVLRQRRNRNRP